MKHWTQTVKLASLFSILGFGGCSNRDTGQPQMQAGAYKAEDYNRLYQEGCDLISPYMQLHGAATQPANTDQARNEMNRGISILRNVVEINPDNWSAYWVIGKAYQALNDSDQACDAFGKSFAIKKDNPDVAREYMFECLRLGRSNDAIAAAKHSVDLRPDDAGLVSNLALAYLIGGEIDAAITCVDKSLGLSPDDEITQNLKKIIIEVQTGKRGQPKSMRDL